MEKEPRKASEVLLELEAKIDILMSLVRTQDLNIKVLSNKVNSLLEKSNKNVVITQSPIKIEAVDTLPPPAFRQSEELPERKVPISPDFSLPIENEPKGFRRTSRPETYSGDNSFLKAPSSSNIAPKFPMQIPKSVEPEIIVPKQATKFTEVPDKTIKKEKSQIASGTIPVVQRIVDKNGKSVFLADVEVIQAENKQTVSKTRTNGAGKWMASLPVGRYTVFVRKRESLNKEKLEIMQDIQIDGTKSPLELQTMIIKS